MLNHMYDYIPKEHNKPFTMLFLRATCLTALLFLGQLARHAVKSFKIQKHCIRLFGDIEKYLDKFKLIHVHDHLKHIYWELNSFAQKSEHTKPLFNKLGILAFQNLFNYHTFLETLKTLKSRTPQSLFQLYVVSTRQNKLYSRARADATPYIKSRVNIWNNCIKLIARSETLSTIIKYRNLKKTSKKLFLKCKMLSIVLNGTQI